MLLPLCWVLPAAAATFDELTPYLAGQYYTWAEHSGGKRLLRETGPLFSTGVTVGGSFDSGIALTGRSELFFGEVGYDGETLPPNEEPLKTDVSYVGTRTEFDLGYRVLYGPVRLEPFAGVGYRWWLRDLKSATAPSGRAVSGYTEHWETGYSRLGIRGRYLTPTGITIFAEGGGKRPFYTGNGVDFADVGRVTFEPAGRWSGFAEAGATLGHVRTSLFYEGFRFGASPFKQVKSEYFFQPDSSADIIGLRVGFAFR